MQTIKLHRGQEAIVDDEDYAELSKYRWHLSCNGYAQRAFFKPTHGTSFMHRDIMKPVAGIQVDHRNGNKLDNRRENLRLCTNAQNCRSRKTHKDNRSGYKGVSQKNQGWQASITLDGKTSYLGIYGTPEDAARTYDSRAKELHGEFARLNFEDE